MPFIIVFPLTWRDCVQKKVVNRQQILFCVCGTLRLSNETGTVKQFFL